MNTKVGTRCTRFLLKEHVKQTQDFMQQWPGRPSLTRQDAQKQLSSNASQQGWGALDATFGRLVPGFFYRTSNWPINVKEMHAAVHTAIYLPEFGDVVHMEVDNLLVCYYLFIQCARALTLNSLLHPLLFWSLNNRVQICPVLVPSDQMRADAIARLAAISDDYSLDPAIFRRVVFRFREFDRPEVDMFACAKNAKLPQLVSLYSDHEALYVNALHFSLQSLCQVNVIPPWGILLQ